MHEVYQALGWAIMILRRKKKQKANLPKASNAKRDKRSPNFTRKAQKCNKDYE